MEQRKWESNKCLAQFSSKSLWKQKLRESCFKRLREERENLLWKMRSSSADTKNEVMRSVFMDVVSDEARRINSAPLSNEGHDILWEYSGPSEAYHSDCEEILLEMQRVFYEDIKYEENGCEKWEEEEDEYLARSVFEHMNISGTEALITWCPVCKQGHLKEDGKGIECNNCELRLLKCDEVNLVKLRDRLSETHLEHCDRGCRSQPRFVAQTVCDFTALYISCADCDTFEVVV